MANSNANEIKKWPILNILDPELSAQVRLALVFGKLGDAAIIVTKDDKVYAFGKNEKSYLGIEIVFSPFVPVEVDVLSGQSVIKFANGHWFNPEAPQILALTKRGEVYRWGHGYDHETPEKLTGVLSDKKVIDIACSACHAMALTDQGEVYFWGDPSKIEGKYIIFRNEYHTPCPTKLKLSSENDEIVSITNTLDSISLLSKTGVIYRSGCTRIENIRKVENLIDIVKLVSGYDHTLALSKEGFLYITGSNNFGQCGNGKEANVHSTYKVPSQLMGPIVDIAAGRYNSAALNKKGQVYMWGLCCQQKILIPTPVHLSNIHDVILYFSLSYCGMRQSLEFGQEMESNLSECLRESFDNRENSDLIIKVQDKPIHVHKAILKLRSGHFKRMFSGDWSEKNQCIIDQKQYSYGVYKAFLKYLYTGNIDASPEESLELKQLANQYLDNGLEKFCIPIELGKEPLRTFPSNVNELKKWPILNLPSAELITQVRKAFVFGDSGNEAIVITEDDKYYGLGTNKNGCLGIGIRTSTLDATEIEFLSGKDVIKLAVGNINDPHVLALTRARKIYSWGYNKYGQLGIGSTDDEWAPVEIKNVLSSQKVVDIACGGYQSLALTNDGKVYQWGRGSASPCTIPSHLSNYGIIKSIACSFSLNVAVSESRGMYFWGQDMNPKTQIIESERFKNPHLVLGSTEIKIEKIVAGVSHLLVLTTEGVLYVWSRNSHGESGRGDISDGWDWHKIPMWMMGPIVDIAAGPHTSAALNKKGEVFMWGQCLGQNIPIPTRTGFSKLSDVLQNFCTPRGTHQLLELPKEEKTNVLESIEQGFDDLTTSDLVIMVHGKPIHVHKIILQLRSSYCERMFKEDWAGKNPIIIRDQHSYEVYTLFFKYLYTERVDVPPANLSGLLELAIQVSDTRLRNYCAQRIGTNERYNLRNYVTFNHLIYKNQS